MSKLLERDDLLASLAASLDESLEVARREGLELRVVSALGMLGSGLGEMYEFERAETYLRGCIEFSEQREYTTWYPRSRLALVEVFVLWLVAGGKRNADVVAELVLSPRTVDHHVSSARLEERGRGGQT